MNQPKPDTGNSSFALSTSLDDYIQLSPLGMFPHSRGIQQVDKTALETLVKNFRSFFARLGRRFAGLPFYVGHPDVSGFENTYTDRKAYGWIMDLQVRKDGLYGKTKWTEAGRHLVAGGHFKFLSPTWTAEKAGTENGKPVFRPTRLVSVGLTNEPNLPVPPLANTSDSADDGEMLLGESVPLPDVAAEVSRRPSSPEPTSTSQSSELSRPLHNSTGEESIPADKPEGVELAARLKSLEESLANCQRELAQVQDRLITNVLDNAIAGTRILPVERKLWQFQLAEDFENASAALANARPQLNVAATTDNLPRMSAPSGLGTGKQIQRLVQERMRTCGLSYEEAWSQVKEDRPELFGNLATR